MDPLPIKICGITRREDALAAIRLGAGSIGFNLYPRSPRHVARDRVAELLADLPPVSKAAVCVHPSPEELKTILALDFDVVQIHAGNLPQLAGPLAEAGRPVILPFSVADPEDLDRARQTAEAWRAAGVNVCALLADAKVTGLYGGTGRTVAWQILKDQTWNWPLILAGGLKPENVAEAIRTVRPAAVDVASGVERQPGIKDHRRMEAWVAAARQALMDVHPALNRSADPQPKTASKPAPGGKAGSPSRP
ncbi:MAG TPA: phosphoribosylanthranilate isomerase [Gemmatales bacterium]|nr:phosphoribosylanthranilate isomerase [Gemmatales bacterium]